MSDHLLKVQQWLGAQLLSRWHGDRGAITTETAVITFLLVTLAGVVLGIIAVAANGWANAIPDAP